MKKCVSILLGFFVIALSSVFLGGCGNDDDGGAFLFGGGQTGQVNTFSSGPITDVDSAGNITLNGVNFSTNNATITLNGSSGVGQDLKAGQVVTVKGKSNGNNGAASDVVFSNMLLGPISAMSGVIASDVVSSASIVVLGQTIKIDRNTVFDPCLNGPASFGTGSVVEVSGLADDMGIIHATFIESKSTGTGLDFNVRGVVSALTGSAFTLTPNVNGNPLTITLGDGVTLPADLVDGDVANVTVDPAGFDPASTSITAKSVALETTMMPSENDMVSAEGFVTQTTGTNGVNTFTVGGLTVDPGSLETPPLGSRVAVDGVFSGGVVMADRIWIINPINFTIGAISSIGTGTGTVSSATGSIVVNGVAFNVDAANIFINGTESSPEALMAGKQVIVTSPVNSLSTGTTGTMAQEIQIVENMTGPISAVTGTPPSATLTVLGQTITIDANTIFEPSTTDFGTFDVNSVVSISGTSDGAGGILATFIQSEQPGTQYHVLGVVSNSTGTASNTFTLTPIIDGTPLTVTLGVNVTLQPCFADGRLVDVTIDPATVSDITSTAITAQAVDAVDIPGPVEGDLVNVEGVVTNLSGSTFTVNGFDVDASSTPGGIPAGTMDGDMVMVLGTVSADGSVTANAIQQL